MFRKLSKTIDSRFGKSFLIISVLVLSSLMASNPGSAGCLTTLCLGGGSGGGGGGGGGGGSTYNDYAILIHGFMGSTSDMSNVKDEIKGYYDSVFLVTYYSGSTYNEKVNGEKSIFDPIGPYKKNGNWVYDKYDDTAARYLKNALDEKLNGKSSGNVDIYVHSMGGLVIRSFMTHWAADGDFSVDGNIFKVRSITTIASPHKGTTAAKLFSYTNDVDLSIADAIVEYLRNKFEVATWFADYMLDVIREYLGIDEGSTIVDLFNTAYNLDPSDIGTGITQINNMNPDGDFISYMDNYKTPGDNVKYYTLSGYREWSGVFEFNNRAFDLIPWNLTWSTNIDSSSDLENLARGDFESTLQESRKDSQLAVLEYHFEQQNGDLYFDLTYTRAPQNDHIVNSYSTWFSSGTYDSYHYTDPDLSHAGIQDPSYAILSHSNSLSDVSSIAQSNT